MVIDPPPGATAADKRCAVLMPDVRNAFDSINTGRIKDTLGIPSYLALLIERFILERQRW